MTGRVGAVGRGPECLGDQYGVPVCCSSLESHAQRGGRHLTLGTARQPGQLPPPSNSSRGLADQCLVASVRRRRCGAIADSAGRSTVDAAPPAPDILGAAFCWSHDNGWKCGNVVSLTHYQRGSFSHMVTITPTVAYYTRQTSA